MSTVIVIGASRGIGYEFARQYTEEGARVIATHRRPEAAARLRELGAKPLLLDVTDPDAVAAVGLQIESEPIDVAILCAGVYGPRSADLAPPAVADFDAVMRSNVLGAMLAIPVLAAGLGRARGKLVAISSGMGSIGAMSSPAGWLYRASKAALNAVVKAASLDLGAAGVVCFAINPGWVRTDMGGAGADLEVHDSVARMRRVIGAANRSHNGKFLRYTGEQLEW